MRNLSVKDKTQPRETKVHHHKTPRTRILDKECHPEENILSMQLLKLGNLRPGSPFILSTRVFNSLVTPMISLSHKITTVPSLIFPCPSWKLPLASTQCWSIL